jgi:RNA polymerase sigma-70 factor, ECF subfamily
MDLPPSDSAAPPSPEALHAAALALLPSAVATRLREERALGRLLAGHLAASARERAAYGVTDAALVRALVRTIPPGGELGALEAVCAADLALALGCAEGHPGALAEFDRRFTPEVLQALRRVEPTPSFADEALQAVRERLFLASAQGPPKIASYMGTGPLAGWVRAVAVRVGLNLRRGGAPQVPLDERVAAGLALEAPGPEFSLLVQQSREAFEQSFREALRGLEDRELNVLRLHYAGGLTLERLAELYGVHRATVARWLAHARAQVFEQTKQGLKERLRVDSGEFERVLELVRSQLELSLSKALR